MSMSMQVEPRDILTEVEDLIRTMPALEISWHDDHCVDWLGRAKAILMLPQLMVRAEAMLAVSDALSTSRFESSFDGKTSLRVLLSQVRHSLRMQTVGPLSISVSKGMVFDHFDGLKKIIQEARADLFVVDPYMDAEFISRYLPYVAESTNIRLLASKHVSSLSPAANLFSEQNNITIKVRKASSLHDRFIFIDGKRGFQSGASFHQGGLNSPTTLTEITDTFSAVRMIYEDYWSKSTEIK